MSRFPLQSPEPMGKTLASYEEILKDTSAAAPRDVVIPAAYRLPTPNSFRAGTPSTSRDSLDTTSITRVTTLPPAMKPLPPRKTSLHKGTPLSKSLEQLEALTREMRDTCHLQI